MTVNRLREAVGRIPFWTSHADSDERNLLAFDDSRLADADEAWGVPVRTSDGPGMLVWNNSD
jgi:hypothetical protein